MILTVLGCSGSVPGPGTPCSGYLVEHEGHRLLLDLGTGAFGALLGHVRPDQVDTVVVSHRHSDHVADLAALAYAQEKLGVPPAPTRVIAPAGTAAEVRRARLMAFEDSRDGELVCGPFRLRLARVRHSVETYAVRVEAGGRSLTYTGDSGPCRELVDLARGTGLLLAEAAFGAGDGPDGASGEWGRDHRSPAPHHLTARQAGELAALSGAGALTLTHLRPWDDPARSLAAAAAYYPGPVSPALPGLRLVPAGPAQGAEAAAGPAGPAGPKEEGT